MPSPSLIMPAINFTESMEIFDENTVQKSVSLSGKVYTRKRGSQVFKARLKFARQPSANLAPLRAFLTGMTGSAGIFYIPVDQPNPNRRFAPGNYVNTDHQPDGKLHMVLDHGAGLYAPAIGEGYEPLAETAYMRCSLMAKGVASMIDFNGLDGFTLTVEERIL